eukprot:CAMPEP_0114659610 /NCGR_PEP_ID=MMETSP0191-20121206/18210_1 /TAXON_ID=126664 /ORGANISM="Sorites sp." /LENGTH=123 /DNA_ID=CAMNT_0001885385 /DNA_START=563 /DNA_END=934 /DNA_ORIENTATION=-
MPIKQQIMHNNPAAMIYIKRIPLFVLIVCGTFITVTSMGELVGLFDDVIGLNTGDVLGSFVSIIVGDNEGDSVGVNVGVSVGVTDGDFVGEMLGDCVGVGFGDIDGNSVGFDVIDFVGDIVGE